MDLSRFPPAVLSTILSHLIEGEEFKPRRIRIGGCLQNIRAARLVCRQWNALAIPHLFETVTLTHQEKNSDDNSDDEFVAWDGLLDNESIRLCARCVVIRSSPKDTDDCGRGWFDWNRGEAYPAFTKTIDRIAELPNCEALKVHFSDEAVGEENKDNSWVTAEYSHTRINTLKAVFNAIRQRSTKNPSCTKIRSLTLENLQNMPIPEFTESELYQDVIKGVDRLHILVAEEYNEHGPDGDVYCIERQEYEPYLQNSLLPPLANQLTNLTLAFGEGWGIMPGYFDGKGLTFPRLKTLTLGNFMIGYHNHLDWVLAQKTLTTLRLDQCCIVSHLRLTDELETWNVRTDDWEPQPRGSYGFIGDSDKVYTFSGTWAAIFDRMRTELPSLMDFRVDHDEHRQLKFMVWGALGAQLSWGRYIMFDVGLLPSPWVEAGYEGVMEFGDSIATPWIEGENDEERDDPDASVNRARETEEEDGAALEALLETVRKRCQGLRQ